jgi:hypothetical protein
MKCEKEMQVIEATRNGLWTSSLRAHLQDCALCNQTELIAASLQEDAAKAERGLDLPPAVWCGAALRPGGGRTRYSEPRAGRFSLLARWARYIPWFCCCGGSLSFPSPSTGCWPRLPD